MLAAVLYTNQKLRCEATFAIEEPRNAWTLMRPVASVCIEEDSLNK